MGIASLFLGKENPFAQFVQDNRNTIHGAFAGLGQGRNFGEGLQQAALGARSGQAADDLYQDKTRGINATAKFLRGKGANDLADLIDQGGMSGADAFSAWTAQQKLAQGADSPSNIQEWQYYNKLSPEDQSRYLNMKRSNTPLNIGTGFVTQDQANPGTTMGAPIAINNQQEAFDKATGSGLGTANAANMVSYQSVSSKLPGLQKTIDDLTNLSDTATYTQLGQGADTVRRELGLPVGQGAIDRTAYISIVDNQVLPLLRDTFGAAFTEREGQSLKDTLGDPNKSPAEKKVILNAFIEQKKRDVQAMQSQIAPTGATPDYRTKYGLE